MNLVILASLSVIMLVTRFPFGGDALHFLDASWAIFFIVGRLHLDYALKFISLAWFTMLAWGIDVWAVQGQYTSAWCMTTAYLGMPLAYAALTLTGVISKGQHFAGFEAGQMKRSHTGLVVSVVLASFTAFVISNLFFYRLSGYFNAMSAAEFSRSVAHYFPQYVLTTFIYVAGWHLLNRFYALEMDVADIELETIRQESEYK